MQLVQMHMDYLEEAYKLKDPCAHIHGLSEVSEKLMT